MAPGQEANCENFGESFDRIYNNDTLNVLIRIALIM